MGRADRDRGEGATSYVGVLLLVAGIVGAVAVSGAGERVADACESAICRVTGDGDCKSLDSAGSRSSDSGKPRLQPLAGNVNPTPATGPPGSPVPPAPADLPPIPKQTCQADRKAPWVDRLHAHNDYMNTDPLESALSNGATSVEADIWLEFKDQLTLKHDKDDRRRRGGTLREQYFQALNERAARNGGQIYPGRNQKFEVFVEVKDGGAAAYEQIAKDIAGPPPLTPDVQVVIPIPPNYDPKTNRIGGTPIPENIRFSASLGPDCKIPPHLDPRVTVLNGEFAKCVDVNPKRKFNIGFREHRLFNSLVEQAHARGRKVRIWGAPDGAWRNPGSQGHGDFLPCPKLSGRQKCEGGLQKNWWQALDEAGADYFVTDHVGAGAKWLRTKCGRWS